MFKFFLISFFLILFYKINYCQNIYNAENSLSFALYLYDSKQYDFAAQEFERVIYLSPENYEAKLFLLKSYRYSENYSQGINFINKNYNSDFKFIPKKIAEEYTKLLLLNGNYSETQNFITQFADSLNNKTKINFQTFCYLFQQQWDTLYQFANLNKNYLNSDLYNLSNSVLEIKYKKPLIALTLSTLIPGLGKIYSGAWKDGLFSLVFIATNSWQAYRGFSKKGVKSAYGWIFSSIAFTFYFGNIYGSFQSAKKYNENLNKSFKDNALLILKNDF